MVGARLSRTHDRAMMSSSTFVAPGVRSVTPCGLPISLVTIGPKSSQAISSATPIWSRCNSSPADITARPLNTVADIHQEMLAQLTSSVRWVESVEHMVNQGVTRFVEIGPKEVLTGLVKRINKEVEAVACGTVDGVKALVTGNE